MADPEAVPYRVDVPAEQWFVGRERELAGARAAIESGRYGLRAYMGGRGMGKSSLVRAITKLAATIETVDTLRIDRPDGAEALASQLLRQVGAQDAGSLSDGLVAGIRRRAGRRLLVLIDEVESLLEDPHGRALLENLRVVYESASSGIAVFVFGGARLRALLDSEASPFLRNSKLEVLTGLDHRDCARLMREPMGLEIDDLTIDAVWNHTNGHPLWIQKVMEHAVDRARAAGGAVEASVRSALSAVDGDATLFAQWWDSLDAPTQEVFARLTRTTSGVTETEAATVLGSRPFERVEILESTGVVRRDANGQWIRPAGELFRQWYRRNFSVPGATRNARDGTEADLWNVITEASTFERAVVEAVGQWVRDMLELPAYALRPADDSTGNQRLQPEDYFQISLIHSLRQHSWTVEAESLSVGPRARADVKVRGAKPDQRACGEVKRWVGSPESYKGIVAQALGYALATDTFAFTVMVDRLDRPLHKAYLDECIDATLPRPWPVGEPDGSHIPAFVTEHQRASAPRIRVYHFLLQFPSDKRAR
jgi:hypothetical protein